MKFTKLTKEMFPLKETNYKRIRMKLNFPSHDVKHFKAQKGMSKD